jgi:hypothetical protein
MPGLGFSVAVNYYNGIPDYYWNFVPHRHIMHRRVYNYYVPRPRVVNIVRHTTIVTNNYRDRRATYFTGPSRREIERDTRTRVVVHEVNTRSTPGRMDVNRRTVNIYRPEVDNSRESRRSIPSKVTRDVNRSSREQVDARRERPGVNDARTNNRRENTIQPRGVAPSREAAPLNSRPSNEDKIREQTRERKAVQQQNEVRRDNSDAVERLKKSERDNSSRELQRRNTEQVQRRQQLERQPRREAPGVERRSHGNDQRQMQKVAPQKEQRRRPKD